MTYSLASQIIDLSKIEKEYTTTIEISGKEIPLPILNSSDRIISDLKGDEILEQALEALEKSAESSPSNHEALIEQLRSRSEFYEQVKTRASTTYGAILEEAVKSLEAGSKTEGLLTKQKEFDDILKKQSVSTFNGSEIIIRNGDEILSCQFKKYDETEEKIAESIRSELLEFSETNKLGLSHEQADYILQSQSTEITPGSSLYAAEASGIQPSYKSIVEISPGSVKVKKCTVNSDGSDFCLIRTSESDITSLGTDGSTPKKIVKSSLEIIRTVSLESLSEELGETTSTKITSDRAADILIATFPNIDDKLNETLESQLEKEEIIKIKSAIIRSSKEKAAEFVKHIFPDIPQEYKEAVKETLKEAGIRQARREAAWEKAEKLVKDKERGELKVSDIRQIAESIRSDIFQEANKLPYVDMVIHLAEKNNIKLSTGAKIIYSFERLKNWWNKRKNPERPFNNFIPKSTEIPIPETKLPTKAVEPAAAPATNPGPETKLPAKAVEEKILPATNPEPATSLRRNFSKSKGPTTLSSSKTTVPTPLRRSPSAPNLGRK